MKLFLKLTRLLPGMSRFGWCTDERGKRCGKLIWELIQIGFEERISRQEAESSEEGGEPSIEFTSKRAMEQLGFLINCSTCCSDKVGPVGCQMWLGSSTFWQSFTSWIEWFPKLFQCTIKLSKESCDISRRHDLKRDCLHLFCMHSLH